MGIFDKLTNFADKAIKSVEKTSDKVVDIYKKEGVDGLLERADKGLSNLEKKAAQVTEQATSYAKEIAKSNKIEIEKAKKDSSDDLGAVVNSGVAVAVNTVSTVARDVTKKAKELLSTKDVTNNQETAKNEEKTDNFESLRFAKANSVPLEDVLKFLGAKSNLEQLDQFTDSHGNKMSVKGAAWYDWNNQQGGKGAVSLLRYELDLSYSSNKQKPVSSGYIVKEAVNILEQISLRQQVLEKETKEIVTPKLPAKKIVKRTAAKKVVELEKLPTKSVEKTVAVKKSLPKPLKVK